MTVREEIDQKVEWLERRCADLDGRLTRASDAGGELASEVIRFLQFPENGDRLGAAYSTFMAQHAGNFSAPHVPPHVPYYNPDETLVR